MALTRKFLKGMGLTEEQISAIIDEHTESTDALIEQRDTYKAQAEELKDAQKELEEIKSNDDSGKWKEKYESEHKAFEDYKKDQDAAKSKADKVKAFKSLLKEIGVTENRIDSIVKITSLDEMVIKDGKFEKEDELKETAKEEWKAFITSSGTKGANTDTPPGNDGGKLMTKEEIYKTDEKGRYVHTTEERQAALVKLNGSSN